MWLRPGTYLLSTNDTRLFGGASEPLNLTASRPVVLRLLAYPLLAYQNATFVLPGWNSLSEYAANCNQPLPCPLLRSPGGSGGQVPLTSWTQDGAFYVNESLQLVFYSFPNRSVRAIAPWVPLHDDLMSYDGVENTEWITADGTYVYEFGCTTSCSNTSQVVVYAVNVSTGRTFGATLAGVDAEVFYRNAQMDLIGLGGNLSIASVIDQSGVDIGYDLWSGAQWNLGTLPYFEANNIYWIAPLQSYFDIQAAGSREDGVSQLRLEGAPPQSTLKVVAYATFANGFECNGVEGLAFNATSRTVSFTAENDTGLAVTDVFGLDANGTLTGLLRSWNESDPARAPWPATGAIPNLESSEHRPTLLSNGPAFAGFWGGWFENRSWLVDPSTGIWFDTNLPFDHPGPLIGPAGAGQLSPAALEGLFLNSTYSLVPWSYDCRVPDGSCPILGNTDPRVAPGTVWWTWRSGAPEFPFPPTAPLSQTGPPSDPVQVSFGVGGENITVRWDPPTTGADPLLNYTLFLGTSSSGALRTVSIPPQATSFELAGLEPDTSYLLRLEAWNLHWHSPGSATWVTTSFPVAGPAAAPPPGREDVHSLPESPAREPGAPRPGNPAPWPRGWGGPEGIRTPDLAVKSRLLYRAELRAQGRGRPSRAPPIKFSPAARRVTGCARAPPRPSTGTAPSRPPPRSDAGRSP